MKKSVIYRAAQHSVLNDTSLTNAEKLPILRELFIQEDLAKFAEEQEATQKAVEG